MPQLSVEWDYWSLMNGLPAIFAGVMFIVWQSFARDFAWNIPHRQSQIFFATGFLMRAGLFWHVINAANWGEIRWLLGGNAVFAGVLLGVTLVYGEMLVWQRPITILWTYLYIEEPVWMLSLVPQAQAAAGSAALPGAPVNLLMQAALWVEAAVMLVAGLYLLRTAKGHKRFWPWQPDTISSMIMAGFPLSWAAWAPVLALAPSWSEARGGVLVNMLWLGATLASVFVFRSHFDLSKRETRWYAGVIAVLLALLGAGFLAQG